jgi:hypothetical protein
MELSCAEKFYNKYYKIYCDKFKNLGYTLCEIEAWKGGRLHKVFGYAVLYNNEYILIKDVSITKSKDCMFKAGYDCLLEHYTTDIRKAIDVMEYHKILLESNIMKKDLNNNIFSNIREL